MPISLNRNQSEEKEMSVVGLFGTHLTTGVGSDGYIDDRSPDERIKFFEATSTPIVTVWFVDLLKPLVIKKLSE